MTFDVKLKTGFFKTQSYFLTVSPGQSIAEPQLNKKAVIRRFQSLIEQLKAL